MYSFIEIDENYLVEELSPDELISILSLQKINDATGNRQDSCAESAPSINNMSLTQRLSKFANEPVADWLIKKD